MSSWILGRTCAASLILILLPIAETLPKIQRLIIARAISGVHIR